MEFFAGLENTLGKTTYTILYRFRYSIMLFHFNERLVETTSLEKFFTTTPTGELKPCIILHHADWETGRTYLTKVTFLMKFLGFVLAVIGRADHSLSNWTP